MMQPQPIRQAAANAIPALNLDEFLDLEFDDTSYIIGDAVLITEGKMLVLALKGVGKTIIVTQIILEVAAQRPVLGTFDVPDRKKCLVFQREIPDKQYQQRLTQAAQRYGGIDTRYVRVPQRADFKDMYLDDPYGLARFEATIDWERPDIIVIDPWDSFHNHDTNDNSQMRNITNRLDRLVQTYHFSLIISHHFKKPSTDYRGRRVGQDMYDTLGASAMINWADTVWSMNETSNDKVHLDPFMRHGVNKPPQMILTRNRRYACFDAEVQDEPTTNGEWIAQAALSKAGQMPLKQLIYEVQKQKIGPKAAERAVLSLAAKNQVYIKGSNGDRVVINLSPMGRSWYK